MDSPIYSRQIDEFRDEVFPQFYRISLIENDQAHILIEYGAAHIDNRADLSKYPQGSICLDRGRCKNAPSPLIITAKPENKELIAVIKAMKPADVSHIQTHDNGCGPAVVAHLTGTAYADAVRKLYTDGKVRILGTQRLADATGTVRRKCKSGTWEEAGNANAVAALIKNTDPLLGRHYGHYVSIDPGMVIVDPELVLHYPLAEYPRKAWSVLMYFVRA